MKFKKFKKIVSKYFEDGRAEKINKTWFNAWAKSSYNKMKDAPTFQVQYKGKWWFVGGVEGKTLEEAYLKWLEGNRCYFYKDSIHNLKRIDETQQRYWEAVREKHNFEKSLNVEKIIHNKKKATTVVWFENGDKVIVKRRKGAVDDVYTAVAFAITKQLFKSNAKYQRCVDECLRETK